MLNNDKTIDRAKTIKLIAVILRTFFMVIYGVALLSFCMIAGVFFGELIGYLIGIDANVGGIGIAMLLLIFIANKNSKNTKIDNITKSGINFWNAMYIPIVVAMAAKQNVLAAISGGWMAITAGVLVVILSFLAIPFLYKFVKTKES